VAGLLHEPPDVRTAGGVGGGDEDMLTPLRLWWKRREQRREVLQDPVLLQLFAHPRWLRFDVSQMPDEKILRDKARAGVRDRRLPSRRPDRTWGGTGVGATCAVCDLPVARDEVEFEIQFARDDDNPGLDKFHLHIRCFAAWEFERRAFEKPG